MKKTKVINIANVSGGVGKSTTTIELATYFGMKGYRVLVVDADMQASATDSIGEKGTPLSLKELKQLDAKIESGESFLRVLEKALIENSPNDLCEVLDDPDTIEDVIVQTQIKNVDLLPSSIRLCNADKNLSDDTTRSAVDRLVQAFKLVEDIYDFILIDNSPAQTLVSTNTLLSSNLNIVPVKLDRKSVKGMIVSLNQTFTIMRRNRKDTDLKVLFTMVAKRGKTENEWIPWLRKHMGDMAFDTVIPYQKKPAQDASMLNKQVVNTNTNIGLAYRTLGDEILALFDAD